MRRPLHPVTASLLERGSVWNNTILSPKGSGEAIANAFRHAQAPSIPVQLVFRSRDVVLSVTDDGGGFQFDPSKAGFGIKAMTSRCEAIKATIAITLPAEGGCRVQVTSPYRVHRGLIRWVG